MAQRVWKREFLTSHQRWRLQRFWVSHPKTRSLSYLLIFFVIIFVAGFIMGKFTITPDIREVIKETPVEKIVNVIPTLFVLDALNPHVVGAYGDNLQWSGSNIKVYNGTATLKVDAENKVGSLVIEFDGALNPEEDALLDGRIKIVMTEFIESEDWQNKGIAKDIILFGDTNRGFDYLPKTKAQIAGWGRANIYLNEALAFDNLPAMFAYTDGIRKPNGKIAKANGEFYNLNEKGSVEFFDANEKELLFMTYMDIFDSANFPNYAFFVHIYFEDVQIKP